MKTQTRTQQERQAAARALVKLFNAQDSIVKLEINSQRCAFKVRLKAGDRFLDMRAYSDGDVRLHLSDDFYRLVGSLAKKGGFTVDWNKAGTVGNLV